MKSVMLSLIVLLVFPTLVLGQDEPSELEAINRFTSVSYFGPRTGISTLPKALQDTLVDSPAYSLFGWQVEIRYVPSHNKFHGFAEAGFVLGAVESGYPGVEIWGYIGIRKPGGIGISLGPNISRYGIGLGVAPHYTFNSGNILIPVILNIVVIDGNSRIQFITGFSLDKK